MDYKSEYLKEGGGICPHCRGENSLKYYTDNEEYYKPNLEDGEGNFIEIFQDKDTKFDEWLANNKIKRAHQKLSCNKCNNVFIEIWEMIDIRKKER